MAAEEGFGGLQHPLLHGPVAEAMALAGEEMHLHRDAPFPQGQRHAFGLIRRHHRILQTLEKDHRHRDAVGVQQGGTLPVGGRRLRPRPDQAIEVARLEAVGVARHALQVGHGIAAGAGPKHRAATEGCQHREARGAAPLDRNPPPIGPPRRDQGGGRRRAVGPIHHTPLPVKPFAVGPAEARGAAVVHIHHPPAAAGPELDGQVQPRAGHAGGSAVALHQQGGAGVAAAAGGVVPGLGGPAAVALEPEGLWAADGRRRQRAGGGGGMAPTAASGVEFEQAGWVGGGGGDGHQAAPFGHHSGQIIEAQVVGLPAEGWAAPGALLGSQPNGFQIS